MAGINKAEREALAEVKSKFDSIGLSAQQANVVDGIRKGFSKLAVDLHRSLPAGRNKSLTMTALEDACMRAVRSVSHDTGSPTEPAAPADVLETPVTEVSKETTSVASRRPRKRTADAA